MIMDFSKRELRLRKVLCSFGMLSMVLFASCEKDDVMKEVDSDSSQEKKEESSLNYRALFSTDHKIGEDEAKELALNASSLFAGDGNGLKSGRARTIGDIRALRSEETTLRSGSEDEVLIPDTLAYVCNFADSAGFAIICADDRVGCPILACVDNGTLGEDTDNPGLAIFLDNAQVFMRNSIAKFEMEKDSLLEVAKQRIPETDSVTLKRKLTGNYYYLKGNVKVGPLLRTEWAQSGDPYNNLMKDCPSNISSHAPAGCWAVAIGQLMAYYKYPTGFMRRTSRGDIGVRLDWDEITKKKDADSLRQQSYKDQVSLLLYEIGFRIGMNWQCDGSGASSDDVIKYMESTGYGGCGKFAYNFEFIRKNLLDSYRPACMSGYQIRRNKFIGYSYSDGHAWIVDGYAAVVADHYSYVIDLSTGMCKETYVNTVLRQKYLHVNWGWGGSNNGYYAEGCFDTKEGDFDYPHYNNMESNYQYKINIFPFYR